MPFTISHVAAVLPFSRPLARWRLLSATVIGSMVPDFGFFMPWRPPRTDTHSALSLLTFCLPVGLLAFWVFQRIVKRPIVEVLPNAAYSRWHAAVDAANIASVKQWLMAAFGVLVGAVSHLVWDGFTHEGARGVRMIPILEDPNVDIGGHHLTGVRLVQDASSLVGLLLLLVVIVYALRPGASSTRSPVRQLSFGERSSWIAGYAVAALLLAAVCLKLRHPSAADGRSWGVWTGFAAVAALRGFGASLVLVSACLTYRLRAKP